MTVYQTLFLFLIYSFIGWAGESLLKTATKKRPVNSGFLNGPVCPIYGFGGFIMLSLGKLFEKHFPYLATSNSVLALFSMFLISLVILTVWEYIAGVLLEKAFNTKYWDYSKKFLNIKGRICLKNSLYWGLTGVIFVKVFEPWQNKTLLHSVKAIPQNLLVIFVILSYAVFALDFVQSVRAASGLKKALDKVKELSESIKLHTEELEFHPTEAAREFAGDTIQLLKIRETRLKLKMTVYAARMRKAFPTMKSELLSRIELWGYDKYKLKKRLAELKNIQKE